MWVTGPGHVAAVCSVAPPLAPPCTPGPPGPPPDLGLVSHRHSPGQSLGAPDSFHPSLQLLLLVCRVLSLSQLRVPHSLGILVPSLAYRTTCVSSKLCRLSAGHALPCWPSKSCLVTSSLLLRDVFPDPPSASLGVPHPGYPSAWFMLP